MAEPLLTIFTPTYNRAHTLPRLFDSLRRQSRKDFEWLVIDDGSSDATSELFSEWLRKDYGFAINYVAVENGGKNRAINRGLKLAKGRYFMILDSDDLLTDDAVEFIISRFAQIAGNEKFIGLSGKKGGVDGLPLGCKSGQYEREGYVDCSNLDRPKYDLQRDMAEVFITDKLRKYEFKVWPGEKFTPEEVVWNQIALDGYILRWYNKVIYLCEYQPGGLSDSTWRLLRDNPMGYAMMWNQRLLYYKGLKTRINAAMQYDVCCILAKKWQQILNCNSKILSVAMVPASLLLAMRRKKQITKQ